MASPRIIAHASPEEMTVMLLPGVWPGNHRKSIPGAPVQSRSHVRLWSCTGCMRSLVEFTLNKTLNVVSLGLWSPRKRSTSAWCAHNRAFGQNGVPSRATQSMWSEGGTTPRP